MPRSLPTLIPLLCLAAACKGPPTPAGRAVLDVVPVGEPEVSECVETAEITLRAQVGAQSIGLPAHFEADGEILWEGILARDLELTIAWRPALGDVRGAFVSGVQRVGVVFPLNVRESESPTIVSFGLFDGASIAEPADLAGLVDGLSWDGAFPVDPFEAVGLVIADTHADLGITSTVEMRRCPVDAPCEVLPTTQSDTSWRAELADIAAARCADLSDRSNDVFEVDITSACGTTSASFEARIVQDDCDSDGFLAALDCDDQDAAIVQQGDISADGLTVAAIEDALSASVVRACGGTFAGGWTLDHDFSLESVGEPVSITAPASGPTITVTSGHVVLTNLDVLGGDAGSANGGAIAAEGADSLELVDVDLRDGIASRGGNLAGPANGALVVRGGVWSGGTAADGANAFLAGGELSATRIENGVASGNGGGLYTTGELSAMDLELENNAALRGAGAYVERAPAIFGGSIFLESHAVEAGGAIAAQLDPGQVLELRPSSFDLTFNEFEGCTADLGGAVWLEGGVLDSTVTITFDASATHGGVFHLTDAFWDDTNSLVLAAEATGDGSFALLSNSTADLFSSDVLDSAADRGALFLTSSSTALLQNVELTGTGCGVWIEQGSLQTANTAGLNSPADVCGPAFESPFAALCTQDGC